LVSRVTDLIATFVDWQEMISYFEMVFNLY